ncbi:hypothetical protein HK097_009175 [Rhizophlyctis rosea]|uniref:Pyrroline-5-carboxylate reductase n=1 Tax=Rhizophlyctis rosea TaxID=64517 RepID=A0AAD5SJ55_9FUNG|nr:hypothetical protein HK097_009175 [Rhizophlyctis rosea]
MPKLDTEKRICFVGGGNMASAIIGGLVAQGYPASNIIVSEPYAAAREALTSKFNVHTTEDNAAAMAAGPADVVIIAVKPQVMKDVAAGIAAAVQQHKPLVITIAAGIRGSDLANWLGGNGVAVVRVMPNTPALVGEGATGMFAAASVTDAQKDLAASILGAVSKATSWVEKEELIDVVTALSGSGPAYFFLLVESIAAAAVELGLPADVARNLAAQTCLGAGRMMIDGTDEPAELRRKVTSPNGTTEAAIKSFEADGFREIAKKAIVAATKRGEELGNALSK